MLTKPRHSALFFSAFVLISCTSAPKQSLQDIPEICRFVDFSKDPEMAKICGLRETRYGGLKNIPPMRFLISPKGGHLALVESKIELRLPNTGEIILGDSAALALDFSAKAKRDLLKNSYEYYELFPGDGERLRLFKLGLPTGRGEQKFCFEIPSRVTDSRLTAIGGQQVNLIECLRLDSYVRADSLRQAQQKEQELKLVVRPDTAKVLSPNQKLRLKRSGKTQK